MPICKEDVALGRLELKDVDLAQRETFTQEEDPGQPEGSLVTFVACSGDKSAEHVIDILTNFKKGLGEHGFLTRVLESGETAQKGNIALITWDGKKWNEGGSLKNSFSGKVLRIPGEGRVVRENMPEALAECGRVVFLREGFADNKEFASALRHAVSVMAVHFGVLPSPHRSRKKLPK